MKMGSTDILRLLVREHGYILVEEEFPQGELTRELIILKKSNGDDIQLYDGYRHFVASMPRLTLDAFSGASFVREDSAAGSPGRKVYRLTPDGVDRGGC